MKVILDIKDSKADFILEILKAFPTYVKTKALTPEKAEIIEGLAESVREVKLHKEGKIQLKSARQLLDKL
jgi:hypothetical protein